MLELATVSFKLIFSDAVLGEARYRRTGIAPGHGRKYWAVSVYRETDFGLKIFKRYDCPRLGRAIQLVEELARIHPNDMRRFNEFRMSWAEVELGANLNIMKERHGI